MTVRESNLPDRDLPDRNLRDFQERNDRIVGPIQPHPDQPRPASPQSLVLLGINHVTAPIEIRERLAIPSNRLADATRTLAHQPGVSEALILSTCNRVELLTLQAPANADPAQAVGANLLRFLHEYFAVAPSTLHPHLYEFREREAVRHLFRVASSLDSLVVGEAQILGQVKESYTVAREVGAVSGPLDTLLQRALTVAKRVRTETQIGATSVSVASVAVDLARKIFGSLQGKTVLLVGAGKMSELAARHLIAHGATSILVANRTESRARDLATRLTEGAPSTPIATTILPFEHLHDHAHKADIVITSTGAAANHTGADLATPRIFTPAHGRAFLDRRRNRPMFFIDIAVPRDVDPGMNKVDGCFVYDIDDLQQVATANLADRSREAAAAETIVSTEVDKYQQRLQSLDAVPAILALQSSAETIRQAELARSATRLATLTPAQREAVEALTRALTAKLLHPQLTALRRPTGSAPEDAE
jgi:glutamyl-tRNA reductase